jgi:hyperosmotically inducible periplasmic protein
MMNVNAKRGALLASLLCATLVVAGCDRPKDTMADQSARTSPPAATTPATPSGNAGDRMVAVIDDTALTAKVKAALVAEPGLKSIPIDVETKSSVVTLTGTVGSAVEKAKAVQVAENVQGVKSVVDNLTSKS